MSTLVFRGDYPLSEKVIDKVGASNILKAKDMYDKLKAAESCKNK